MKCDNMKLSRILIVIVLFVAFFEVGLMSSYTIVTSEVPDVQGLIDMQVEKITGVFNSQSVNDVLVKDPTPINITNDQEVALSIENLSKVDGVDLETMNVTTYEDTDVEKFNVTIESNAFDSPNSTSSQIVISQDPSYKVVSQGIARYVNGELIVDPDSIRVTSILKLY